MWDLKGQLFPLTKFKPVERNILKTLNNMQKGKATYNTVSLIWIDSACYTALRAVLWYFIDPCVGSTRKIIFRTAEIVVHVRAIYTRFWPKTLIDLGIVKDNLIANSALESRAPLDSLKPHNWTLDVVLNAGSKQHVRITVCFFCLFIF